MGDCVDEIKTNYQLSTLQKIGSVFLFGVPIIINKFKEKNAILKCFKSETKKIAQNLM